MEDYPLSAMSEGARTAIGGVVTFAAGIASGTALALFISGYVDAAWYVYPVAAVILLPYALFKIWGLLLLPLYGVVFYGLVWHEWNRVCCFALLAISTSLIVLISLEFNPFAKLESAAWFVIGEGLLIGALIVSYVMERKLNGPTNSMIIVTVLPFLLYWVSLWTGEFVGPRISRKRFDAIKPGPLQYQRPAEPPNRGTDIGPIIR